MLASWWKSLYIEKFPHDGARKYNEPYISVFLVTLYVFNYLSVLCISVSDENKKYKQIYLQAL